MAWWSPSSSYPEVTGRVVQIDGAGGMARNFSCGGYTGVCAVGLNPVPLFLDRIDVFDQYNDVVYCTYNTGYPTGCTDNGQPSTMQTQMTYLRNVDDSNIAQMMSESGASSKWQGVAVGSTMGHITVRPTSNAGNSCSSSGPVTTTPTITYTGQTAAINGTTQQAVTGQQIALSASVPTQSGVSVTSSSWTLSGQPIGGYSADVSSGVVQAIALSNPSVVFYWPTPSSSYTAAYTATLSDGTYANSSVIFNTSGPSATFTSRQPFRPALYSSSGTEYVGVGKFGVIPGITFNISSQGSNPPGSYIFVQLIHNYGGVHTDPYKTCPYNSGIGIDNVFPYARGMSTTDSPAKPISITDTELTVNFSATMYAMWQSSTASSIPVPIGAIDWQWSADAVQNNNQWSLNSGSGSNAGNVTIFPSYPQWSPPPVMNGPDSCQ